MTPATEGERVLVIEGSPFAPAVSLGHADSFGPIGFAGLLLTSATGAKAQWMPRARPSRAVTSPLKRAAASEPVALAFSPAARNTSALFQIQG